MKNGLILLVVIIILIALVPLLNNWQKEKLATDLAIAKANVDAQEKIAEDNARIAEANKQPPVVQQQPTLYYVRVPYYIPYPHPHPNPPPPPPPMP